MNYKIIEVHCIYEKNELQEVAVLWQSNNDGSVRASLCDTTPCGGYKFIMPGEKLTPSLIQDVAGQGMNLSSARKVKYFPGIRKWDR